jgi:type 1 fimbria pilin
VKTNPFSSGVANTPFTIELIKTSSAPVKGGLLASGTLVYFKSLEDGVTFAQLDLTGNNAIVPVACSIMTPSLTFPIGDVLVETFSGVIGTTPRQGGNTQNLGLDCDAAANINISLSGIQNPDVETSSVLALTGQGNEGVAKGVGVQLLYNDVPLELNNRIVLKPSTGGQESLPITARYYQTQTEVTPGTANASATLNLTYQ